MDHAILCVILFSSVGGAAAAAEPLPAAMSGRGAVPYDPPVGAEGDMCLPEGAFCSVPGVLSWMTENDVGPDAGDPSAACCSGNCQLEACTESIPGSCFGTCGPALTFSELQLCSSSADCGPTEFCTTDTEPCGFSIGPSGPDEFCIGVCLPTQPK